MKLKIRISNLRLLAGFFALLIFSSAIIPNELLKVSNKLKERKYKIKVRVDLYEDGQTKNNIIESQEMSVNVWGKNMHYRAGNTEAFATNKYQIVIDHKQKIILINKAPKDKKDKNLGDFDKVMGLNFDSLLNDLIKVQKVKKEGSATTYRIEHLSEDSDIDYTEYMIDTQKSILISSKTQYAIPLNKLMGNIRKDNISKKKPYISTHYETFEYTTIYNKLDFEYQKILQIDNKAKAVATKQYQTYKILNYLKVS